MWGYEAGEEGMCGEGIRSGGVRIINVGAGGFVVASNGFCMCSIVHIVLLSIFSILVGGIFRGFFLE